MVVTRPSPEIEAKLVQLGQADRQKQWETDYSLLYFKMAALSFPSFSHTHTHSSSERPGSEISS